ncbi:hypothetical protein KBX37_14930 [Micromonospora sp. U56]|nr:hypothetical protein [Micromonospora sp. U56]
MSITFSRPTGAFLYAASKPRLLIEGDEVKAFSWGTHRLPLQAGRHRVQAWVPYILPRKAGWVQADIEVGTARTVEVEYVAPTATFAKGRLGAPDRRKTARFSPVSIFNGLALIAFILLLAVTFLSK